MARRHIIPTTLMVAVFMIAGASAAERVYKWVDADGAVHFGQQPPANSDAEVIKVQSGVSAPDDANMEGLSDEEKQAAADAETCRMATDNFNKLSGEGDVERTDEYGETRLLTPEEKISERARAEAAMKRFCKPEPTSEAR